MPIFKVRFERDYSVREGFDRYIEADNQEGAEERAGVLAAEFDQDCPDDLMESGQGDSSTDFWAEQITPVDAAPASEEVL